MIGFTTFTSTFDNVPVAHELPSWEAFADYLEIESRIGSHPSRKGRTTCICPAAYREPLRRKVNVSGWDWFAFDIDNKGGNRPGAEIPDIIEKCEALNLPFVIYTTTSSQDWAQCYRLMIPLSRTVTAAEFPTVWGSLATWLGCVDRQTRDESRLFIAPRRWDGADNHFIRLDEGDPLDVDAMVLQYPPEAAYAPRAASLASFALPTGLKPLPGPLSLHSAFVTPEAHAKATRADQGGRMFGFLCSAASRALLKGYEVSIADLVGLGRELAATMGRSTADIEHDARNALQRAAANYAEVKANQFDKMSPNLADRWRKRSTLADLRAVR